MTEITSVTVTFLAEEIRGGLNCVLVAGGGQTAIAIVGIKLQGIPLPAPVSHIIAGAIGGMLLSYFPIVLVFYWMGKPSW